MDVTIQVLSDGNLIAVKTFGSPLTAAEAKAGLQDECSTWVGTLTGENTSTVLVGERQLSAGSTYNLKLRQQSAEESETVQLLRKIAGFAPFLQAFALSLGAPARPPSSRGSSSAKEQRTRDNEDNSRLQLYRHYHDSWALMLPKRITCQISGLRLPSDCVVEGHLFPKGRFWAAPPLLGDVDLDSPRNRLLWGAPFETAYHTYEIALLHTEGNYRLYVLTDTLMSTPLRHYAKGNLYELKTFGDFHGNVIRFPPGKEPYHRALLYQAVSALTYQRSIGKLRPELQLDPSSFEVRSKFGDAETKKALEAWVEIQSVQVLDTLHSAAAG